jgi:hypothetical protein
MKLDEIMKLIDAGYTKADIDALTAAAQSADQPAEQAQQDQQASDQPAEQTQQPDQQAQQPAADPILEALNKLKDTIIQSNINRTVQQPAERTPEQALAEIIAPPKPKMKER